MQRHKSCTVERRKVVSHLLLNLGDGTTRPGGPDTTEVGPCGTPLFGEDHQARGICRSCMRGWTHPHNAPTEAGLAAIKAAGGGA